jgi:hypothetical protein
MSFRMRVYVNGKLTVTETNPEALPFWQHRKRIRALDGVRITWEIEGDVPSKQPKDPVWLSAHN